MVLLNSESTDSAAQLAFPDAYGKFNFGGLRPCALQRLHTGERRELHEEFFQIVEVVHMRDFVAQRGFEFTLFQHLEGCAGDQHNATAAITVDEPSRKGKGDKTAQGTAHETQPKLLARQVSGKRRWTRSIVHL